MNEFILIKVFFVAPAIIRQTKVIGHPLTLKIIKIAINFTIFADAAFSRDYPAKGSITRIITTPLAALRGGKVPALVVFCHCC